MLEIGSRVQIHDESLDIYDFGEIQHIISGEMLPFQILCDKGDEDGHRVLRFAKEHIMLATEEKPAETTVEPLKEVLPVIEIVQSQQTFQAGQQYFARLRASGTHYDLYTEEMKPRGCMPASICKMTRLNRPNGLFKKVKLISDTKPLPEVKTRHRHREAAKKRTAEIVAKTIKERKIKKAKTIYDKMELLGQINIFDILEGGA